MLLLKRENLNFSRKGLLAAAILLTIPCALAAFFVFRFDIDSARAQEPAREQKRKWELEDRELKIRIERETSAEGRAQLEELLRKRQLEREQQLAQLDGEKLKVSGNEDSRRLEEKLQPARQIELVRQAKITMEQAIQIATSKRPGKVYSCSLVGDRWEGSDKAAPDAQISYRVVIFSNDATNPTFAQVQVNAMDGTIVRVLPKEGASSRPRK